MDLASEARRLYRWVTTNPLGATVGVFVSLVLLLLTACVANGALPAKAWLRATPAFLGVSVCFGAAVFVRQSPRMAMIKPPWLSWSWLSGLALQVVVALLVVYGAIGNWLGFVHPSPGAPPWLVYLPVALSAIVAAVGIYRNQWWAFFLELVVLWIVIVAVILDPSPPTPARHHAIEIPFLREFQAIIEDIGFLIFNWKLFRQGLQRRKEQDRRYA